MSTLTLVLTAVGSVLLLLFLVMKEGAYARLRRVMVVSMGAGAFQGCRLIKSPRPWKNGRHAGLLAIVVALGAEMFGKILHETGAVDQIAVKCLRSLWP